MNSNGDSTRSTGMTIDDLGLTVDGGRERESGPRDFLSSFFQLFRTAEYHAIDNSALEKPVHLFQKIAKKILEREGSASLQAKDGNIFFNSSKIKLTNEEYEIAETVFEFFEVRGMGGFSVSAPLGISDIHGLLEVMVYADPSEQDFDTIARSLKTRGIPLRINRTLGVHQRPEDEVILERRSYTFFTYSKLVVLYRSLLTTEEKKTAKRNFIVRKISRTIEALIDICLEDDHTFLGISSVKSGEAYAPHHAANVAVLSISLGGKIGLAKADLADLGLAAVFANIGQDQTQDAALTRQRELSSKERESMQRHTLEGVDFLLGETFLNRSVLRRIAVAFGHHLRVNGTGYPSSQLKPDLFSRIVAIADTYDALTTDRPWRSALLPDEALAHLIDKAGEHFDPILVKVFVNTVGMYPVGTLVRLDSGELAFVIFSGGEGQRVSRPIVALLDSEGKPGQTVDLAETDDCGAHPRSIVQTEDPTKYGLRPSGLIAEGPVA